MIIKNASVFQEDGTFKTQDIYIEGDKIAENGSGDVVPFWKMSQKSHML